jgi:AcrR family transcriptional regulator
MTNLPEPRPHGGRSPGRPRSIDERHVAATALALFWEHGFDAVTLTQVAQAAGVGRTTLLRAFPTKTDLLWDRSAEEYEALRAGLADSPATESARDVLQRVIPSNLHYGDDELDVLRRQTLLIAKQEQSLVTPPRRLDTMYEIVAAFLRSRWKDEEDLADLAAAAVTLTAWRATVQWAESDEPRPWRRLEWALDAVLTGFRAP